MPNNNLSRNKTPLIDVQHYQFCPSLTLWFQNCKLGKVAFFGTFIRSLGSSVPLRPALLRDGRGMASAVVAFKTAQAGHGITSATVSSVHLIPFPTVPPRIATSNSRFSSLRCDGPSLEGFRIERTNSERGSLRGDSYVPQRRRAEVAVVPHHVPDGVVLAFLEPYGTKRKVARNTCRAQEFQGLWSTTPL